MVPEAAEGVSCVSPPSSGPAPASEGPAPSRCRGCSARQGWGDLEPGWGDSEAQPTRPRDHRGFRPPSLGESASVCRHTANLPPRKNHGARKVLEQ